LINSNDDDDDDGKFGIGDAEEVDSTVGAEVGGRGSCPASRASGTIAGSVVDEGGEAAGTVRRIIPSFSSSSSRRRRISTHLTPISRPRTQQQERSADSPVTELAMWWQWWWRIRLLIGKKDVRKERRDAKNFISKLRCSLSADTATAEYDGVDSGEHDESE
jgi:hypothetical protein